MNRLTNADPNSFVPQSISSSDISSHLNKVQLIVREKLKYTSTRAINQFIGVYYTNITNDPYSPHVLFDKYGKIKLISGDHIFSLIDTKDSSVTRAVLFAKDKFNSVREQDPTFFQDILGLDSGKDANADIIAALKILVEEYAKKQGTYREDILGVVSDYPFIKELYRIIPDTRDFFDVDTDNGQQVAVSLSDQGRHYISSILSDFFARYESYGTLGKDWKTIVFPDGIYAYHLKKILHREVLSEKEINDMLSHLFVYDTQEGEGVINYIIENTHIKHRTIAKNAFRGHKSFIINHTYGGLYVEQGYNHGLIKQLTASWYDKIHQYYNDDTTFTEGSIKSLPSMSDKELRGQQVGDMTRLRTWMSGLSDMQDRAEVLAAVFKDQITSLSENFAMQGWNMHVTSLDVANKYEKGAIRITSDEVNRINSDLGSLLSAKDFASQYKKYKKQSIPKIVIDEDYCHSELHASPEEIDAIKHAFGQDISKTGGNGGYADIKIRMTYVLENKETGEIIANTGGYEHQIVDFASHNEAGLSSHHLILDPRKNIVNQIREKGQINVEEFSNIVYGGVKSLLGELCERQDMLSVTLEQWHYHQPRAFIEQQFEIRNQIPVELCILAGFAQGTTYTSIANNINQKVALERAVERYILKELFAQRIIHPYLYINESIHSNHTLSKEFKVKLKSQNYQQDFDLDIHLDRLLDRKSDYRYLYRICGGGSGNLTKTVTNATLSEKGYVGVVYDKGDGRQGVTYIKMSKLANILYHSIDFEEQEGSIVVQDFAGEIAKVLGDNGSTIL